MNVLACVHVLICLSTEDVFFTIHILYMHLSVLCICEQVSVSMSACTCPAGNRGASLEAGNMQKQWTGARCHDSCAAKTTF